MEVKKWRVEGLLENTGLLPLQAKRVLDIVQTGYGENPPSSLAEELALTRTALTQLWRRPPPLLNDSIRPHILVGSAGAGKTTALCKWLTQAVLVDGRAPRVWRLDGAAANNAEFLSLHGEILGLETRRSWQPAEDLASAELNFIDVPGVDWRNPAAVRGLEAQLQRYRSPQLHLVLNAAYDVPVLLAQLNAFQALPIADLIFTHLDEEPRWGKLWNFILGTNYVVRFLSAGQNIPGHFQEASAEKLLNRLFP
jgi:flagellar biosynthesis protein FlhF